MERFFGFLVLAATIFTMHVIVSEINSTQKQISESLSRSTMILSAFTDAETTARDAAYLFAPQERSTYQLRGDAQEAAQAYLDKMIKLYGLPQHELPTMVFTPAIRHLNEDNTVTWFAAAAVPNCEVAKEIGYRIQINELLFLRNYEHFMHITIPHEISHIITCMRGGFVIQDGESRWAAAHGEEWEETMSDLGFVDPPKFKVHDLDVDPIIEYRRNLAVQLQQILEDEINDLSPE